MDQETRTAIEALDRKVDAVYESVEKIRTYLKVTFYVTIATIVVPLIAVMIIAPMVLSTLTTAYSSLDTLGLE